MQYSKLLICGREKGIDSQSGDFTAYEGGEAGQGDIKTAIPTKPHLQTPRTKRKICPL
jgi:hypothetical protein